MERRHFLKATVSLILGMLAPKAVLSASKAKSPAGHLLADPVLHLRADLRCQHDSYKLWNNPLAPYLALAGGAALIEAWGMKHWGAYQTTWEIDDGRLYLIDVFGFDTRDYSRLSVSRLFPQTDKAGRVFAHWFCGELFCPYGEHWTYGPLYTAPGQGHMDWRRVKHQFERRIDVKHGVVRSDKTIQNDPPPIEEERYEIPDFLKNPTRI